jgi:transcriptional regulator with XRE-family HTH domain
VEDSPVTLLAATAANVKAWRKEDGLSQEGLAAEFARAGLPVRREVIAKIETGRRDDLTITEVLGAAEALITAPVDLLLPADEDALVQLLPGRPAVSSRTARAWLTGERWPAEWIEQDGALVDVDDRSARRASFGQALFHRRAPTDVQIRHSARRHDVVTSCAALLELVETGALAAPMVNLRDAGDDQVAEHAAWLIGQARAVRRAAARAAALVEVLAQELEDDAVNGPDDGAPGAILEEGDDGYQAALDAGWVDESREQRRGGG